jgi:tRNA(Ile)-lysidine synthase
VTGDPQRVVDAVQAGGLLPPECPVLVMLSGGRDSVCLLDVALRLVDRGAVSALHVNYGLRVAADEDERHCLELCNANGVELTVVRPRPPGPPRPGNLQAWARDLRYGSASRLALRLGARVAAGHTATDQAETVLYRLASSPGRRALLGMPRRDGLLVRPLLDVTREETAVYCRARGLAWREDQTNADARYARARVRASLVPALRSLHPAAERNVVRTVRELRDEAAVLDTVVANVVDGRAALPGAELAALAPALRRLVLRRLAEDVAGRPAPQAAERAEEVLALCERPGSVELALGDGVRAVAEYGNLRFALGPPPAAPSARTLPVPGAVRFGSWVVHADPCPVEARDGALDLDALGGHLSVRGWRHGDRMAPLGLGGTRTLQDLFTDRKLPRERRRSVPVVECDSEIAWVPGIATSERFRITRATTRAVRLSAVSVD